MAEKNEVTLTMLQELETKILKQISENLSSVTQGMSSLQETVNNHETKLADARKVLVIILETVKKQQKNFGLSLIPKGAKIYGVDF